MTTSNLRHCTEHEYLEFLDWLGKHANYKPSINIRMIHHSSNEELYVVEADYYDKLVYELEFTDDNIYTQYLLECTSSSPGGDYIVYTNTVKRTTL